MVASYEVDYHTLEAKLNYVKSEIQSAEELVRYLLLHSVLLLISLLTIHFLPIRYYYVLQQLEIVILLQQVTYQYNYVVLVVGHLLLVYLV